VIGSHGILHVNLKVSDRARSFRFYTKALGFSVVSECEEATDLESAPDTIRSTNSSINLARVREESEFSIKETPCVWS
jgi:catechol 2,3-dioxygenase-like lactoylglutathione lyase family enzyme